MIFEFLTAQEFSHILGQFSPWFGIVSHYEDSNEGDSSAQMKKKTRIHSKIVWSNSKNNLTFFISEAVARNI